ncbi:MAG: helix-turn-helix domain-containing protein [Candidatus Omnitrophota bacterium]|nr:helix-turn-helix domain-containing protein [Candidatus Omnitrophota bacterium]
MSNLDKNKGDVPKRTLSRSQIMTPKEAAKYLGIHLITTYRLIKKGEIPGFRVGGQWRFKKDVLDSWILKRINANDGKK